MSAVTPQTQNALADGLTGALPEVAVTVTGVVLTIGIGFWLRKRRVIADGADATVLRLLVRIFIPALIVSRVLGNEALEDWQNLVVPPAVAFGLVSLGIGLSLLVARLFPSMLPSGPSRRTFALTTGMFNYGYITIPLVMALFTFDGGGTLAVLFVFNVGVEAAMWGVGLATLAGKMTPGWWRRLFGPPVLATLLAVAVNLADQWLGLSPRLPTAISEAGRAVMTSIGWLAGAAIPLGLLLTGSTICDDWAQARLRRGLGTVAVAAVVRLAVMPAIFLLIAVFLPITTELRHVLVFQAAMPAAVFPIVLTRHYHGDVGTALRVVVGTSILAILTMPAWIVFGLWLIR